MSAKTEDQELRELERRNQELTKTRNEEREKTEEQEISDLERRNQELTKSRDEEKRKKEQRERIAKLQNDNAQLEQEIKQLQENQTNVDGDVDSEGPSGTQEGMSDKPQQREEAQPDSKVQRRRASVDALPDRI